MRCVRVHMCALGKKLRTCWATVIPTNNENLWGFDEADRRSVCTHERGSAAAKRMTDPPTDRPTDRPTTQINNDIIGTHSVVTGSQLILSPPGPL